MGMLGNKVAIVTGAASGFGAEISRLYVKEGAKVVVADLNEAGAKAVAGELGGNAIAVKCDVAVRADINNLVAAAIKQFGTVDIVVNNAGYTHKNQSMLETDEAAFDRCFAVNVKAIYLMAQSVVPVLRQKKSGVIINVGSVSGIRPRPVGHGLPNGCGGVDGRELPESHWGNRLYGDAQRHVRPHRCAA